MFVKIAVDEMEKTSYDDVRNMTWYRKGELYHVYTGDHH